MDPGRLQRPEARRLTLIRDLLDRLPDTSVSGKKIVLPPLDGKPQKERYGVLKPIASFDEN